MRKADSLEKTLMLGKIEGRRRGRQRMRWLDGITDMDMSLSKLRGRVKDWEARSAAVHGVTKRWTWLSDWKTTEIVNRSVVARWGKESERAQRIFRAMKLTSMILQWWVHIIIHLSKPIKRTAPSEPYVNYGPWVIKMYQCSVQFSRSVVSDSLRPHESQHARPPCQSPTPGALSVLVHQL